MSDEDSQNRELEREIRAIKEKVIPTQRSTLLHSSQAVTGGREFLDNLSFEEAAQLDKSSVKIIGVAFDYDFNDGEWAK